MEGGSRRVQYLVTCSVSIAAVTMGCLSSWPTPMTPKFLDNETNIEITKGELTWMVAMSAPGFMTGSLTTSYIADKFGRRNTILASVFPTVLGTIIVVFASKSWWLFVARFVWGIANGMIGSVSSIYFSEISDKDIRGTNTLVTRFMFSFGSLLTMSVGPFDSYTTFNYMLLVMPLIYLVLCWWIPESPYYLLKEGKVDAARKTLMSLRGYRDEKILEDDLAQLQVDVKKEMKRSGSLKELFVGRQYRKALIITTGLRSAQILTGGMVIQHYLGLIMKETHTEMKLSTMFIVFGAVRFTVGIMSSILVDRVGRRPLLIYSFLGCGLSLTMAGTYFFLLEVLGMDRSVISSYSFITFAGIIFSNIISTLGFLSVVIIIPAELFPMNVKSIAVTCMSILGGSLNFLIVGSYQIVQSWTGLCGVFGIFAIISFAATVFSYFMVPETKGKSLREIQMQLQGDLYNLDDVNDTLKVGSEESYKNKELKELIHKDTEV